MISDDSHSLPDLVPVTSSSEKRQEEEEDLSYELQQGYRILCEFLLEKHRSLIAPFLNPVSSLDYRDYENRIQEPMWLLKLEDKFADREYQSITEFVADFRLMLENCYRYHGVDHWLSKQAQKLEMMLEQKLTLLSRPLREKTTIAVTSKGRYGLEDEKGVLLTPTRRRSSSRSLSGLTAGVFESVMVQALRLEEQQRAKEEKRLREQERKEAEEANQKEIEEWEKNLLAQAEPTRMETTWEVPAIGHFLCLAQQVLNLPEIVFYELERCLLMPQCSVFLAKIMTSLLSPPHRRPTLHRRPTFSYRTWEAALSQKVHQWYSVVGQAQDPNSCAEKLGLCPQFFRVLGETNPLENTPFHELPFYQKVWLLKGLCDFVYETQKEVQDAVLGQPIHECREVILGYDSQENSYIHFPQFCGADIRIYKQRPHRAPEFPIPHIKVHRAPQVKIEKVKTENFHKNHENIKVVDNDCWLPNINPKEPQKIGDGFDSLQNCPTEPKSEKHTALPEREVNSSCETKKPRTDSEVKKKCLDSSKENLEKPSSPGEIVGYGAPLSPGEIRIVENGNLCGDVSLLKSEPSPLKENAAKTCKRHMNGSHSGKLDVKCLVTKDIAPEQFLGQKKDLKLLKMRIKKKKKKKKKLKDILNDNLQSRPDGLRQPLAKSYRLDTQKKSFLMKKKAKHKKHKSGKKSTSKRTNVKKKKIAPRPSSEPSFKLICTNLDDLRELITKTEEELKELDSSRKKSAKWYYRRQAVKELHCTLMRLLNELLPWEPKLIKAFQKNRSRLKKDYDDFKRQPDHGKFIRDLWTSEEIDMECGKETLSVEVDKLTEFAEQQEIMKNDSVSPDDTQPSDMELSTCRMRPLRKEGGSKEIQKALPKTLKRQCKQSSFLDEYAKEFSPRKKIKPSLNEVADNRTAGTLTEVQSESWPSELKQTAEELSAKTTSNADTATSSLDFQKPLKPIQALLAKNVGNKVTLTSQLPSSVCCTSAGFDKTAVTVVQSGPTKPTVSCQAPVKNPLQMLYKRSDGSCVPINLSSSPVKIAVQPVIDPKTGEKLMQQVLILPKNFLIQQKEGKPHETESHPAASCSQTVKINVSSPVNTVTQLVNLSLDKNTPDLKMTSTLSGMPSAVRTSVSSPSITTSKVSQPEMGIIKNILTTPMLVPTSTTSTISTMVQPVASAVTLCKSAFVGGQSQKLTQQHSQSTAQNENKQELKTVCIRDSESIHVTTRGGNTGVVKVQTSSDQNSPSTLSPNTVFTYTQQLPTFLVSNTTLQPATLTSSSSSSTAAISGVPLFGQSSSSSVAQLSAPVSFPAVPAGLNQILGKGVKIAISQTASSGELDQVTNTAMKVSSPSFLPTVSSNNSLLPATPSTSLSIINMSASSLGTVSSGNILKITPPSSAQQSFEQKRKNLIVTQPESYKSAVGDLVGTAPVQKIILVTSPSVTPCSPAKVTMVATPTCSSVKPQTLRFVGPPVTAVTSASSIITEPLKQAFPLLMAKTYPRNTEQPQVVLIPSSLGASIKTNSSSTVSQVKDVKIGLNIGQAIVNTCGSALRIPAINMPQKISSKKIDEQSNKGFVLPLSTVSNSIPGSLSVTVNESIIPCCISKGATSAVATGVKSVGIVSSTSILSAGTQPAAMFTRSDTAFLRNPTALSNKLPITSTGNDVASSALKAGHFASSVLIAATKPSVSPQQMAPASPLPVIDSFPVSLSSGVKGAQTASCVPSVPLASQCLPLLKGQPQTLSQVHCPQSSVVLSSSTSSITRSPIVQPAPLQNLLKMFSPSSSGCLVPVQQSANSLLKPTQCNTPLTGPTSAIQSGTAASAIPGQVGVLLNGPCVQQKILINTSAPLAPGTQIMFNNTKFVVPPQGLGAGSHILLISGNAKQGPSQFINNVQGAQSVTLGSTAKSRLASSSFSGGQDIKLQSHNSTQIVNSVTKVHTSPVALAAPQVSTITKTSIKPVAVTATVATPAVTQSRLLSKPVLATTAQSIKSSLSSDTVALPLDMPVSKLLVSPEGAILNTISTPAANTRFLSPPTALGLTATSSCALSVIPPYQAPSSTKPNTAAS
uniref:Bromodomain containing 10 n=1 Tax=Latimeria chalumnae TaxID=7897 RepID=H3AUF5_LATCH